MVKRKPLISKSLFSTFFFFVAYFKNLSSCYEKYNCPFPEKDGNTLVVVTADHETGGFTLGAKQDEETRYGDYRNIGPSFATGTHSATLIPVFAFGPGAEAFKGMYQNTGIFHKMKILATGE